MVIRSKQGKDNVPFVDGLFRIHKASTQKTGRHSRPQRDNHTMLNAIIEIGHGHK